MELTDIKKKKEEAKAKNAKFGIKLLIYTLLLIIVVLSFYSSLYSLSSIETEGYTTNMLCIGNATVENDFKCFLEFTFTNRF